MPLSKMRYRTKKIYSGKFLEVEMYPVYTGTKSGRSKKEKPSSGKQKNLNDKNAKKNISRLVHNNFAEGDLMITLSYNNKNRPSNEEQAKKDIDNYLRRIKRYRQKNNLEELKYIAVIEYKESQEGKNIKLHHHLIINSMDRDEAERIWGKGYANTMRLEEDENGLEGITRYIIKDPQGKKRVKQSRNLKQPVIKIKDDEFTKRTVNKFIKDVDRQDYFERKYKNYHYVNSEIYINDITGVAVSVKLRKLEKSD
jgi:hypothetical protein